MTRAGAVPLALALAVASCSPDSVQVSPFSMCRHSAEVISRGSKS